MVDYVKAPVSGTIYWAKVFKAVPNYDGDGKEWSLDFVPDDVSFLKEAKLLDRLKEAKEPISGDYIRLKKPETNKDGELNEPIRIYDANNQPWDKNTLIGNGSRADVILTIADFGKGKKKAIWVKAIRITDHVQYTSNEFSDFDDVKKETSTKKTTKAKVSENLEDLDDDMPF